MPRWPGDARGRLLRAAQDSLDGPGTEAVTVTGVAERAGVSRSTFFRYFHGKAELLSALREDLVATCERAVASQDTPGSQWELLAVILGGLVELDMGCRDSCAPQRGPGSRGDRRVRTVSEGSAELCGGCPVASDTSGRGVADVEGSAAEAPVSLGGRGHRCPSVLGAVLERALRQQGADPLSSRLLAAVGVVALDLVDESSGTLPPASALDLQSARASSLLVSATCA